MGNRSTGLVNKLGGIATNLTINPNFTSDTAGWTATDSTLASVSNELEITETGGVNPAKAYQDIITLVGRKYQFNFSFKKGSSATGSVKIGTIAVEDEIYTGASLSNATLTAFQTDFIATETTTRITLISDSAVIGETCYFDAVKCHPIYNGFKDIFKNGKAAIYTSSRPDSADLAVTGLLVTLITKDGDGVTGLTFEDSLNGVVSKSLTEIWQGKDLINSNAVGYIRFYEEFDDISLDSSLNARLDLSFGTANADIILTSLNATIDKQRNLNFFKYIQPKS